jgi:hypothetical protein
VGFEPAIPAFEGMKTVQTLNRAATVIDEEYYALNWRNFGNPGQEVSRKSALSTARTKFLAIFSSQKYI